MDWTHELLDQMTFLWDHYARPRLDGLTDEEYFWEPVPNMWGIRRRADAATPMAAGGGEFVMDYEYPEPEPIRVTTIGWRLNHLIVGVFGDRNASHFGGPPMNYETTIVPPDAASALQSLDGVYATWIRGVSGLDDAGLQAAVGPTEGPFAESPFATLVLHIHREAIHHLAEIALLRDLFANR